VACELNDHFLSLILGNSGGEDNDEGVPSVRQTEAEVESERTGEGEGVLLNEWGALLLYDQVTALVNLLEDSALALVDESIKHCLGPLLWAMKVLTLDRPGDVKRSGLLPASVSGGGGGGGVSSGGGSSRWLWPKRWPGDRGWDRVCERDVKRLLRRRADFSRDAIAKLKLLSSSST
jgi:hypothetical protein